MPIPKKIHYVWVGDAEIPIEDKKYIAGWRQLNPDYEIRQWTEKDIDLKKYPLVSTALKRKRWALASDIIRMYAVYKEGGIYMDTDVELYKPLDELLKYNAFAGWEAQYWFTTAIFGAEKHSQWIRKILKRYELADPNKSITATTFMKTVHSPSVYAQDIYNIDLDGKTRVYGDNLFATFAPEYFSPKHYVTGEEHVTKNTIAYHHYASTWHTPSIMIKSKLSSTGRKILGPEGYRVFEKGYHASMERKIRKELP